ncbi:B12-binding domain-containing radical SAM protein, partial [Deltaproteobacteria bacterium]|nr:B12-binding domain-containing radical SAM protein [Deltaproteobacteria bacterium]
TSIMGLTPEETLDRIQKKPDVCLVSSMFSMEWPITQILIDQLKVAYPECVIIGGGEHFSAAAKFSLDTSSLDICVLGEGEASIRELIERMLAGERTPLDVAGTMVKDPNTQRIISNEARDRIREVRVIPYPAWEYFNVDGFLDEGVSNTGSGLVDFRAMPIVASRGCPYQCTFCSNPSMWGNLWKARPPQDVVNEFKKWIDRYQISHFDFCDLTAIVKKDWIITFCNLLIEEDLSITWGLPSGTRSEALDREVLELLSRSGCNDLDYAPENGSKRILKIMKKKINKERMLESMRCCHEIGITSKANIIFGYPEENRRDVLKTYKFIVQMAMAGIDDLLVTTLSAYPGSQMFDQLQQEGKVTLDENYFLNLSSQGSLNISPCYSNHYSRLEQHLFKIGVFTVFYVSSLIINPKRLCALMLDLLKGRGSTRLSMGILNLIRRWGKIFFMKDKMKTT